MFATGWIRRGELAGEARSEREEEGGGWGGQRPRERE
jgi:hypothetical protein